MEHVVCFVPAAPIYKEPAYASEMISQAIFGEAFVVMERSGSFWVRVKGIIDQYEGWITKLQIKTVSAESARQQKAVLPFLINRIAVEDSVSYLPMGALVEQQVQNNNPGDRLQISDTAKSWLNVPYLWGGRTLMGVDCSGFVQIVFRVHGINLLRDAHQQAGMGTVVDFLQAALPGDVAFFDNEEGKIIHTGILISTNTIIHAAGKVRIDNIDNHGIVHSENGERTHKLRIIKRFL